MAKDIVEQRYRDVVQFNYGDTDSLFLKTVEKLSVTEAIKYTHLVPLTQTWRQDLERGQFGISSSRVLGV
jgi:DNA polymerase elongation subunit (family B)